MGLGGLINGLVSSSIQVIAAASGSNTNDSLCGLNSRRSVSIELLRLLGGSWSEMGSKLGTSEHKPAYKNINKSAFILLYNWIVPYYTNKLKPFWLYHEPNYKRTWLDSCGSMWLLFNSNSYV